jgi:hypothetical protein
MMPRFAVYGERVRLPARSKIPSKNGENISRTYQDASEKMNFFAPLKKYLIRKICPRFRLISTGENKI